MRALPSGQPGQPDQPDQPDHPETPTGPVSPDATAGPVSPAGVPFPALPASRPVDRVVGARRLARATFGGVLVMLGVALAFNAGLGFPLHASALILSGWLAAFAAGATIYALARARSAAADPGRLGDRHLVASLALPVAGLALVFPLSLHAAIGGDAGRTFDDWVVWSFLLVGHCHVALALMGAWRMVRLARGENSMKPAAIYGVTVGLAMVPGAAFVLIPPFLVAATGLAFLFILWFPTQIIARERAALAASD